MKKFVLGILTTLCLTLWVLFAQTISPDTAEISVKDPIKEGEATNLKITILKNWSKMTNYNGTILILVTDENWTKLKDNEYTVPSRWMYSFLSSDLWEKEFQKWLEIKKDGNFYIEVSDLNDNEDKILWKQLVHVTKNTATQDLKHIEITYPIPNWNLIGQKVEIIWSCSEIPNSEAIIYIDDKPAWTTRVNWDWRIVHTIQNITEWQHSLSIEIPDLAWNIMWSSDKIFFTNSSAWNNWIKNIFINPEKWLMVWDMTSVTVYTDDMVESVKMKLSDRLENDSMVMNKVWLWEFNQNVFLIGSWEINLSFDISSANNTINESYDNYKTITVSDVPSISDIDIKTDIENKSANITRNTSNQSIVSSYLIEWRIEGTTLSWKERSETTSFKFNDVPYDTTINLNITPYRANTSKHWAASKTIQFVISKQQQSNSCWNWICENWENNTDCPQDCSISCGNLVCEAWERYETCPQDCAWWWKTFTCLPQAISTHTEKIWNNYYLVRDKAENITKYIVYSSASPDWKDKVKVYETTDTSYEYPFDHTAKEDIFMYFRVIWVCENWEELELTWSTKVQVWPAENFFLLMCLTFLIYFWIKLFRETEV